jgi:HAMP domain-containing protein
MPLRRTARGIAALKRQDYFSKKWFQARIILAYLAVLLAGAAGLVLYLDQFCRKTLRLEMYRGHSTAASPWEILRGGVVAANLVAAAAVIAVAIVLTLVISRFVARSATRVADNLRGSIDGRSPDTWAPPPRIYEFQHLHQLLADALSRHQLRLGELRDMCRILGGQVRAVRERLEQSAAAADPAVIRNLHARCERVRSTARQFTLPEGGPARAIAGEGESARGDEVRNVRLRFQFHWILQFSAVSLLGSAVLLAFMKRAFTTDLGKDFKAAFFILKHYRELLLPILGFSVLFYMVVASVLAGFVVLLLSHRIAGPLFRLERFAEHLSRGDLSFSLRAGRGEELRNLLAAAERLQGKLVGELAALDAHLARVDEAWESLDAAEPGRQREQAVRTLALVEEQLSAIERSFALPAR